MSIHMKQKDEQKVPVPTEEEDRRLWDSSLSTRAENFKANFRAKISYHNFVIVTNFPFELLNK